MKYLVVFLALALVSASTRLGLNNGVYEYINSQQSLWKAGHNARWDEFTFETLHTQFGTIMTTPPELELPELQIEAAAEIPESFDSRQAWPNCESLHEVRDQSTCGSCWAFGAAEAMSDRICIASGQKVQTRVSTEDLLSCCGSSCGFGCNGGYPSAAWSFFQRTGLVTGNEYNNKSWCRSYSFAPCEHHTEGKYPACGASQPTPKCTKACHTESKREYNSDTLKSKSSYSVPNNVAKIQTEIMTNGPVEAAFTVYEDFLTYKSGVYKHTTGSQLGGHAIKIIGWGVENSTPYWLVVNSWNEDWGDKGTFKIVRGSNHCGIEGSIVAGAV